MSAFSNFHRYLIWPLVEKRNNIRTTKHLGKLNSHDLWTSKELKDYQLSKIRNIVQRAYHHTRFYKDRFDNAGIKPENINTFDDLKTIEPVSREDLNTKMEQMLSDDFNPDSLIYSTTGGSTGLATTFANSPDCIPMKKASEYRFNQWCGWHPGEKILTYWPALTDFTGNEKHTAGLRHLLYSRHLKLFSGRLNDEILEQHFQAYQSFQPNLIRAFPSALERFAEYIASCNVKIGAPKAIISVGEPLREHQKKLLNDVFSCPVYNCYVSRECGNIACECSMRSGLHIAEDMIYLEIDSPDETGYGEILLTDFTNAGMPLIRYQIQDMARFVDGICSCGRPYRRISVDAARKSDFLISPVDGSYVSGSTLTHYLLAEGPKIGRVKLIQDSKNHIQIIVTGTELSAKEGVLHIEKQISTIFQNQMQMSFEFVESIPLLKSGKYSFVERRFDL